VIAVLKMWGSQSWLPPAEKIAVLDFLGPNESIARWI